MRHTVASVKVLRNAANTNWHECDSRSRRCKSWEMQQIQTGTKDAENSWFSKQQYGFMQTTKAQWNCKFLGRRCRKLMILQAAVRLYANNVRVVTSRKKYRKCNVPWEMQQTHDAAFISTHLRNQRSAEIRRKPMKPSAAVPHIYVALRFCKQGISWIEMQRIQWGAR